jgi:hypothetical protein
VLEDVSAAEVEFREDGGIYREGPAAQPNVGAAVGVVVEEVEGEAAVNR